jgi:hypothetical protein
MRGASKFWAILAAFDMLKKTAAAGDFLNLLRGAESASSPQ